MAGSFWDAIKNIFQKEESPEVTKLRTAAEQGDANAQNELGLCYEYGRGIGKNSYKAAEWYRKSAEQGFACAQCNLGLCYEFARGVEKNNAKAVEWYRKSADGGFVRAYHRLGLLLCGGDWR